MLSFIEVLFLIFSLAALLFGSIFCILELSLKFQNNVILMWTTAASLISVDAGFWIAVFYKGSHLPFIVNILNEFVVWLG